MTTQQDVIDLAVKKKYGPADKTAGIRINTDEKERMQKKAKQLGLSFSQLVTGMFRWFITKGKL